MFCKASVFVTLLAASAQLVAANTPSCLLAAVNTQDKPADLQAVCKNASAVQKTMSSTCGDNAQAAMAAFKSVCQGAGVQVAAYSSSASSSSSSTSSSSTSVGTITASATGGKISATSTIVYTSHYYDSSCSCTKSALMTGTAYVGPSGIATGTSGANGTSPAQATGTASTGSGSGSDSGSSATAGAATGSASPSTSSVLASTGAAGRVEIAGLSMGALAMAGLVMVL